MVSEPHLLDGGNLEEMNVIEYSSYVHMFMNLWDVLPCRLYVQHIKHPWAPLFRLQLKRPEGVGELSLCRVHIAYGYPDATGTTLSTTTPHTDLSLSSGPLELLMCLCFVVSRWQVRRARTRASRASCTWPPRRETSSPQTGGPSRTRKQVRAVHTAHETHQQFD